MIFTHAEIAREFILAGEALFTASSLKTGAHYTFLVQRASGQRWFVKLLVAPDQYEYVGVIDGYPLDLRLTGKSKHTPESVAVKAFRYMFGWLSRGVIPENLEIRHSGKCGRCGRVLTYPGSIDRGIGPECLKIMAETR